MPYYSTWLAQKEEGIFNFFAGRKCLLSLVIIVNLIAVVGFNYQVSDEFVYKGRNVTVAAHRGDVQNAPENSLSSIKSAIETACDMLFDCLEGEK